MKRTLLYLGITICLLVGFVPTASASPPPTPLPEPGSTQLTSAFPNCVQMLSPGGGTVGKASCFATHQQAVAYALKDPAYLSMSEKSLVKSLQNAPVTPNTTYVIGVDADQNGNTYTWTATSLCSSSTYFYAGEMPSGWNDRVTAAWSTTTSHCAHYVHYQNEWFNEVWPGGAFIDCGYAVYSTGCTSMGTMNKQTSSEKWTN